MPDMVNSKLRLQSVFRCSIGCRHDSSVVDEPVDRFDVATDFLGGLANLSLRAEIKFEKPGGDTWCCRFDGVLRSLDLCGITTSEDEEAGSVSR